MENQPKEKGRIIFHGERWALIDFGKDAFGTLALDIFCEWSGFVSIAVGECLKNGRLDSAPGQSRIYYAQSFFGDYGLNHLKLVFPEHRAPKPELPKSRPLTKEEILPFRYVEVQGDFSELAAYRQPCFGDFDDHAASFESSDEALNRVWEFCKYSIKATNCFEHYVDGNRERLAYEADAYINQLGHFCCDASYWKARNTIDHLLNHPTWPIEWRLIMPAVVRDYVLYSGDTASAARWRAPLREFLLEKYWRADGTLPQRLTFRINQEDARTIVDWPPSCLDGCEFGDGMTVPAAYLYNALLSYDELYGVPELREQAFKLRDKLRERQNAEGLFPDLPGSRHCGLHAQMFPAYFKVTDAGTFPRVLAFLRQKKMACSVYGAQFLLGAMYELHDGEGAYRLLTSPDEPGWLHMLSDGATITMEAWSNANKPNQDWNHPWGAAPANIIPRYLAGIRPLAPGFSRFIVAPQPGPVEYFRCRHPTPRGSIVVEYHRQAPTRVILPDGTSTSFSSPETEFTLAEAPRP